MFAIKFCISVLALSVQASRVLESSAAFRAKMWMKAHDPSADEAGMNDLKNSDPNAFAIVQALLTKKSLGLLDPSHPSVTFTGKAPPQRKSFQEEAEAAGLTQDEPSAAVSEMEMRSSMPYPSAGSSAQPASPYPEVHASHDPWNYHTTHSDDDLIASVVGNDAAPAAQPASDNTLSLSAATQQIQQSMPAPVEHDAPVAPAPLMNGMPSLNWGNPMTGSDSEAPAAPAAQPAEEESVSEPALSLSAVRNQEMGKMGITDSTPVAPAAPVEPARSPLENDQIETGIPSMNWDRPSRPTLASLVRVVPTNRAAYAAPEPAPVATNSYLANSDLTSSTAGMDTQTAAQQRLSMSTFHSHMSEYRSGYRMNLHANDATPSSDSILAIRKQAMGNSYDSFLKQARTNRWKRAMDVTMNMKSSLPGGVSNQYLSDLN